VLIHTRLPYYQYWGWIQTYHKVKVIGITHLRPQKCHSYKLSCVKLNKQDVCKCHAQRNVKYESKWQWHCTTLLMAWYEWLLTGYSWHQFEGSEYPNGSQSTEVHVHFITKRKLCNEPVEAITSYHYHKLLLIYEYIRSSSQLG